MNLKESDMAENVKVCKVSELSHGKSRVVSINGKDVAVYQVGEEYFALDDMCPHAGASLSGGYIDSGCVICPLHAWRFSLHDGTWVDNPKLKIGSYQVQIENDTIFVKIPECRSDSPENEE